MKIKGPGWPDKSGWYAVALFVQTGLILALIATVPALRTDEFFKSIATAIVVTGWIGFAVGQRGSEKERESTGKALDLAKSSAPTTVQPVNVVNTSEMPVQVEETKP